MRKVLEDLRLARIDKDTALVEIWKIQGNITLGQRLGIMEVTNRAQLGEINVDEAEQRLNEIFEGR